MSQKEKTGPDNTVDKLSKKTVYMDIGCWQGKENAKSTCMTFGLVAGRHIVLACYNNSDDPWYIGVSHSSCFTDEQLHEEKADDYSAPIFEVLKGICKQSKTGANYYNHILQWVELKSTHSFTEKGELLVFIPDLHLHREKGTVLDNFSFGRTENKIVSLEETFCQFLQKLADLQNKYTVKVFQLGDLYELWESWFNKQWNEDPWLYLEYLRNKLVFSPIAKVLDKDHADIYKAVVSNLPEGDDVKKLKEEIDNRYADLFSMLKALGVERIPGNHDNWIHDDSKLIRVITNGQSVVYAEHGHRWDSHNSPDNWQDGYFYTCMNVVAEESKLGAKAKRLAGLADKPHYKDVATKIRQSEEYKDRNFLYVMAHTHEPYLEVL